MDIPTRNEACSSEKWCLCKVVGRTETGIEPISSMLNFVLIGGVASRVFWCSCLGLDVGGAALSTNGTNGFAGSPHILGVMFEGGEGSVLRNGRVVRQDRSMGLAVARREGAFSLEHA